MPPFSLSVSAFYLYPFTLSLSFSCFPQAAFAASAIVILASCAIMVLICFTMPSFYFVFLLPTSDLAHVILQAFLRRFNTLPDLLRVRFYGASPCLSVTTGRPLTTSLLPCQLSRVPPCSPVPRRTALTCGHPSFAEQCIVRLLSPRPQSPSGASLLMVVPSVVHATVEGLFKVLSGFKREEL